jgi:hypothetical protein
VHVPAPCLWGRTGAQELTARVHAPPQQQQQQQKKKKKKNQEKKKKQESATCIYPECRGAAIDAYGPSRPICANHVGQIVEDAAVSCMSIHEPAPARS